MSGPPALPLAGTLVIAGQIYVDKMIGTSAPAKPAARRFSSRRPAAAATPGRRDRVRRHTGAEAPSDDGQKKKAVSERMSTYWAERTGNAAK